MYKGHDEKGYEILHSVRPVYFTVEQVGAPTRATLKGDVLGCRPFNRLVEVLTADKVAHLVQQVAFECQDGRIYVMKGVHFK